MMRFLRMLHKWLSVLIGLQVLLWLVSGLVMSLLDASAVSGEDLMAHEPDVGELITPDAAFVEPQRILAALPGQSVRTIEIRRQLGYWVWRAQTDAGIRLFDARNGAPLTVGEREVRRVAEAGYFGDGRIVAAALLTEPTLEARGQPLPLWRVTFDDDRRTRYYISADDGRILGRRNDLWQVFDLFWMLHTMDYVGRDDFNTPWVIAAAFGALWLAISGVLLLVRSFGRPSLPVG
jgi:hypothetical protein